MDLDAEFTRIRTLRQKLEPIVDDLVAMVANYKSYSGIQAGYGGTQQPAGDPALTGAPSEPEQPQGQFVP